MSFGCYCIWQSELDSSVAVERVMRFLIALIQREGGKKQAAEGTTQCYTSHVRDASFLADNGVQESRGPVFRGKEYAAIASNTLGLANEY